MQYQGLILIIKNLYRFNHRNTIAMETIQAHQKSPAPNCATKTKLVLMGWHNQEIDNATGKISGKIVSIHHRDGLEVLADDASSHCQRWS